MTSVHVLVVPWLYSLSEPVVLHTHPYIVLALSTTVVEYLQPPLSQVHHPVKKNWVSECQSVHGANSSLHFSSMSLYQVSVVLPVSNVGHPLCSGVLAWRICQWKWWYYSHPQMIWVSTIVELCTSLVKSSEPPSVLSYCTSRYLGTCGYPLLIGGGYYYYYYYYHYYYYWIFIHFNFLS